VPNYQDFQVIGSRIKEVLMYNIPPCISAEYSRNDTQLHATQGKEHHDSAETHLANNLDDMLDEVSSMNNLKYTLVNIEREARKRGLLTNENKTKSMDVMKIVVNGDHLRCEKHEFEHVKEFSYLGSQLNQTNSTNSEIQTRILSGNRCYYAYRKLMKSRALNRSSRLKIYKSLIRPVVTYGCEAWTLIN
jgi:hypothetical protein